MILASRAGNVEVRSSGLFSEAPLSRSGWLSNAGPVVTWESAAGLPAVTNAIGLIAETVASLPLIVYRGRGADQTRATGSWQYKLLHDAPSSECSTFDFYADVAACVEAAGNAFVQKLRGENGRVAELYVLDPEMVRCYRDRGTGEKLFDVAAAGGTSQKLTTSTILHIRGFTLRSGLVGISPIQAHRHALGAAVAQEEFAGRYFRNNAQPGIVLSFPNQLSPDQAAAYAQAWNAGHQGSELAHKTGVVGGGVELKTIPISAEDAQFVETQRFSVAQVARIFRVEPALLGEGEIGNPTQAAERFVKFTLLPRLRRIEQAFRLDPDLFGAGAGTLYPEFLADALLRADTETRYRAYKDARQGSWITSNEIRGLENMPPVEGGDEIQMTPVGGAPNPRPAPAPVPEPEG